MEGRKPQIQPPRETRLKIPVREAGLSRRKLTRRQMASNILGVTTRNGGDCGAMGTCLI